jgi:hypothetical protein
MAVTNMATNPDAKCIEAELYEPNALIQNIGPVKEELEKYKQMVDYMTKLDQGSLGSLMYTKDGKNHNPGGILNMYAQLDGLSKDIDEFGEELKQLGKSGSKNPGYTMKIGDKTIVVDYSNTVDVWRARLKKGMENYKALYKIYQYDICMTDKKEAELKKKAEAAAKA